MRAPDFVFDPDLGALVAPPAMLADRIAMDALQTNFPINLPRSCSRPSSPGARSAAMAGLSYLPLPRRDARRRGDRAPGLLPALAPVAIDIIAREELDTGSLTLIDNVDSLRSD